ncbi:unnamed protein product, partial [Mesorhabditis belari]|uniref:Uncharacterized protein n=1 Tax=Mesorhabditis belari TaxID=2138241 RepID=A0AAF3JAK5_9BILA
MGRSKSVAGPQKVDDFFDHYRKNEKLQHADVGVQFLPLKFEINTGSKEFDGAGASDPSYMPGNRIQATEPGSFPHIRRQTFEQIGNTLHIHNAEARAAGVYFCYDDTAINLVRYFYILHAMTPINQVKHIYLLAWRSYFYHVQSLSTRSRFKWEDQNKNEKLQHADVRVQFLPFKLQFHTRSGQFEGSGDSEPSYMPGNRIQATENGSLPHIRPQTFEYIGNTLHFHNAQARAAGVYFCYEDTAINLVRYFYILHAMTPINRVNWMDDANLKNRLQLSPDMGKMN